MLALSNHIFAHGVEERFYSKVFKYHHEGGKVYWSMDPTPEATDLINRCDEDQTYEAPLAAGTLPRSAGSRSKQKGPALYRRLRRQRGSPARGQTRSTGIARTSNPGRPCLGTRVHQSATLAGGCHLPRHAPHEYTVPEWRGGDAANADFDRFVTLIRRCGYADFYYRIRHIYWAVDEQKYWTMGWLVAETTVINRARVDASELESHGR